MARNNAAAMPPPSPPAPQMSKLPDPELVHQWLQPWQQHRKMYQEQLNKQMAPSHTPPGPASSHFGPSPSPSFWAPGIEGAKPSSLSPVIVEQHLMKTRPMPNAEMASQKPPMLPNPPTPNSSRSTPIRRLEARAAAMEEAANQIGGGCCDGVEGCRCGMGRGGGGARSSA